MASLGNVLVIDDLPQFRQRIAIWLASLGYCPYFVPNATDAEAMQRSHDFNAVLYGHEFSFPRTGDLRHGHRQRTGHRSPL